MGFTAVMYLLLVQAVPLFIQTKHRQEYMLYNGEKTQIWPAVLSKAICTEIILLTGLAGITGTSDQTRVFAVLVVAGLALGLAGDVAICFNFIAGMVFFGLGHFCYIAAILCVTTHALWSVPVFVAVCLLVFVIYKKNRMPLGKLLIPTIVYGVIIICMLSLAATVPFSIFPGGVVLFLGAVFFAASDIMLAMNKFTPSSARMCTVSSPLANSVDSINKKLDTISLCCYYLGQSLFAISIYVLA